MDVQLRLFPQPRPLLERFGREFFRRVPRKPGVYVMTGAVGRVLYIGQASDLRERLASYKYVRPSGKTWRLACQVRAITWEICDDSASAGLRENQLLRLHKPTFNVMNTRAEHYPFIGLRCAANCVELRVTKVLNPERGERIFGAFKGLPLVRAGFLALMRLLWAVEHQVQSPFDFPSALLAEKLDRWTPPLTRREIAGQMEEFFEGSSVRLLDTLARELPAGVSRFQQALQERDLEVASEFYARGPKRTGELRSQFELRDAPVAQNELDDLLLLARSVSPTADASAGKDRPLLRATSEIRI